MKLYTRSGDDGSTGLFGGRRVGKDHPRVEAYGCVDELNAAIGLAASACDGGPATRWRDALSRLQARLFDLGADLATPPGSPHEDRVRRIDGGDVEEMEKLIDELEEGNEPLRTFVLPGGSELAARLHFARTVCRRAERAMVALGRTEKLTPASIAFVNRVGDMLFAMARRANRAAGIPDVPWQRETR
jgi:cob(I)alamin adenosyltransferase